VRPSSRLIPALPILLFLLGCGKELGRVAFTGEGSSSGSATLAAGDVYFWTDIDIAWQGDATLTYDITLEQGGKPVATATCNPLGHMSVKTSWVESNVGPSHSRSGGGRMDCTTNLPTGGVTTVKTKLAFARKPASVTLRKADLVIKQ
jgi:hypothetical protein